MGLRIKRKEVTLVDPDTYDVMVESVEIMQTKFGESLKWIFEVVDHDEFEGEKLNILTGLDSTIGVESKLNTLLTVAGVDIGELDPEEELDTDEVVGTRIRIVVEHKPDAKNPEIPRARVTNMLPKLSKKKKKRKVEEEEEEEPEEKPSKPARRRAPKDEDEEEKPARRRRKPVEEDEEEEAEEKPARRRRKPKVEDEEADEPEEKPKPRRKKKVDEDDEFNDFNATREKQGADAEDDDFDDDEGTEDPD